MKKKKKCLYILCQMVSELFRKVQDRYLQQRELGWRGKGHRQHASTAASHFLHSLTELTARLARYRHTTPHPHFGGVIMKLSVSAFDLIFSRCKTTFIHCLKPNYIKVTVEILQQFHH